MALDEACVPKILEYFANHLVHKDFFMFTDENLKRAIKGLKNGSNFTQKFKEKLSNLNILKGEPRKGAFFITNQNQKINTQIQNENTAKIEKDYFLFLIHTVDCHNSVINIYAKNQDDASKLIQENQKGFKMAKALSDMLQCQACFANPNRKLLPMKIKFNFCCPIDCSPTISQSEYALLIIH